MSSYGARLPPLSLLGPPLYLPFTSPFSASVPPWGPTAAGLRRESMAGNNPFLLHVVVQSVLQIDVEVEEPEASENPTQSRF